MKSDLTQTFKNFILLWIAGYIFFYVFPFPSRYIPFGYELTTHYLKVIESINFFIGQKLLGLDNLTYDGGRGSGDTSFDYVFLLTRILLSFVLALVLFLLRNKFNWIKYSFPSMIVYVRYFVGITLIKYGVSKFMIGQFPSPSILSMEQTFGNFSPMGLAWRFFGYSDLYKGFMGVSEIVAGGLLLFRRTVVVGAMLSIAVAMNIVMVNFSFDVPVKLLSSHLLLFSVLILLPHAKQLFETLILYKTGNLVYEPKTFSSNKKKWTYRLIKYYMVLFIPISMMVGHYLGQSFRVSHNPWEGAYEVLTFEISKENFPVDAEWTRLILDGKSMIVEKVSGERSFFSIKEFVEDGIISLSSSTDLEGTSTLQIVENVETYQLTAHIGDQKFDITAKRKMKSDYFLMGRKFNWVNENPVNR